MRSFKILQNLNGPKFQIAKVLGVLHYLRLIFFPMSTKRDDRLTSEQCWLGQAERLTELRDHYHAVLTSMLLARGATYTEASDLLADLWGDCVSDDGEKPSLLERFSGKCPIKSWLITVATNRLFDLKRRQRLRRVIAPSLDDSLEDGSAMLDICECEAGAKDEAIASLLQESLEKAFSLCPTEVLLMLHLIHLHGLTQREIARMWGWHESKVSRHLANAMEQIEATTLQLMSQADPWMQLTWQDFVDLCETHRIGFF